jgi:hypothetical protein
MNGNAAMGACDMTPSLERVSIQPMPLFYDCNDYHLILFLDGHPAYESVEAMVREEEGGRAMVRVILTRLDKTQVDHTNDEELPKLYRKREVHLTPLRYERSTREGRSGFSIGFESFAGEALRMEFRAASPATSEHATLFDPLGHSSRVSLPVMFPERVALADAGSALYQDGPGEPRRFGSKAGFYSENFRIGVLRASREQLRVCQAPSRLGPGQQWVYESGGRTRAYEIQRVQGDTLRVRGRNELITAEVGERSLALRQVSSLASSRERRDSDFTITFQPPLPISPAEGREAVRSESDFSISIDDKRALLTGRASSERSAGQVRLVLRPAQPLWATGRQVSTAIEDTGNGLHVDTEIAPG